MIPHSSLCAFVCSLEKSVIPSSNVIKKFFNVPFFKIYDKYRFFFSQLYSKFSRVYSNEIFNEVNHILYKKQKIVSQNENLEKTQK